MKHKKITIKLPPLASRVHRVLFAEHSPYKTRTVQGRPVFKRRAKHKDTED